MTRNLVRSPAAEPCSVRLEFIHASRRARAPRIVGRAEARASMCRTGTGRARRRPPQDGGHKPRATNRRAGRGACFDVSNGHRPCAPLPAARWRAQACPPYGLSGGSHEMVPVLGRRRNPVRADRGRQGSQGRRHPVGAPHRHRRKPRAPVNLQASCEKARHRAEPSARGKLRRAGRHSHRQLFTYFRVPPLVPDVPRELPMPVF